MIAGIRRMSRVAIIILGATALVGCAYVFLFSDVFAIKSIEIKAPSSLNIDQLRADLYRQLDERVGYIMSQKNIFAFDEEQAKRTISSQIRTSSLSIKKSYPHTIIAELEGKELQLLWYSRGSIYKIDAQGRIAGEADQGTIASMPLGLLRKWYGNDSLSTGDTLQKNPSPPPLIADKTQHQASIGEIVIDPSAMESLLTIKDQCRSAGFDMAFIVYEKNDPALTIIGKEGWEVYARLDSTIGQQLNEVGTLLSHSIGKNRKRLKYIDVRFDNRGYYALHD